MTDRFYIAAVGAGMPPSVTEGAAATPASPFEFRMTYDATGVNKVQALRALEAIKNYITTDTFPPV